MLPASSEINGARIMASKVENGFVVNYYKEVKTLAKDQNNYLYDYINKTYTFETIDRAIEKIKELLAQ